jgi:Tol biopolymer transport system component
MDDLTPFERRLAGRLEAELARIDRPWNPSRIAIDAMATRRRADRLLHRLRLGGLVGTPPVARARLIALATLLLVGIAIAAIAAGMLLRESRPPEDPRLAMVLPNSDLVLANADGSGALVVGTVAAPGDSFRLARIAWAPGGARLALSGTGPFAELAIVDRDGREIHRRSIQARSEIDWSPDGRWLAVLDGRIPEGGSNLVDTRLEILAADGKDVWSVPLPPSFGYDADLGNVAWSPDGRRLAITGASFRGNTPKAFVWLADLDARTLTQLTDEVGANDYEPAWLPDGSLVIGRHGTLDSGLWRFDLESGATERLLRLPDAWCPADCLPYNASGVTPSPDGLRIAYFDPVAELSVLEIGDTAPRRLLSGGSIAASHVRWSDDGRELIFILGGRRAGDETSDLIALDVMTGEQRLIAAQVLSFDWLPAE